MNKWIGIAFIVACLVIIGTTQEIRVPPRGYNIVTSSGTNSIMDGSLSVSNDFILKGGRALSTATGNGDVDMVGVNTLQLCIDTTWTNINFIYNGNNDYLGLSVRGLTPLNSGVLNLGTNAHIFNQIWANSLFLQGAGITNAGYYNGASGWTQYVGVVDIRTVETNALQTYSAASSFNYSNVVLVSRGQFTNIVVGGTFFFDQTAYTNVSSTPTVFTNLGTILIPGNMLTNKGDVCELYWEVDQKAATVNTNNFKVISGALTPADFGLQITSNGTVIISTLVTRMAGNSALRVTSGADFSGTQGKVFNTTNIHGSTLVLDCGTNNPFTLQVSAQAFVAVTNSLTRGKYYPTSF